MKHASNLLLAAMLMAAGSNRTFSKPRRAVAKTKVVKPQIIERPIQSFTINGQTIDAYSRKDAIKRLKHQKRI